MAAFLACLGGKGSKCGPTPTSSRDASCDSASCRWNTENVAEKLGVRYQAVTAADAYLTLLYDTDRAAIPRDPSVPGLPHSDEMLVPTMYRDFVHALLDFNDSKNAVVTLLTRKIKRAYRDHTRTVTVQDSRLGRPTSIGIDDASASGSGLSCPSATLGRSETAELSNNDNPCLPPTGSRPPRDSTDCSDDIDISSVSESDASVCSDTSNATIPTEDDGTLCRQPIQILESIPDDYGTGSGDGRPLCVQVNSPAALAEHVVDCVSKSKRRKLSNLTPPTDMRPTTDIPLGSAAGLSSITNAASDKACAVTQHSLSGGLQHPLTCQTTATCARNIRTTASQTTGMIGRPVASTCASTTNMTTAMSTGTQTYERQDVDAFISSLTDCRKKIIKAKQETRWHSLYSLYGPGCDNMLRFITALMRLLRLSLNQQQLDEDAFRLLFLHFAWIFKIDMRLVNSSNPLVVQGKDVQSTPDLIYEKFPDETRISDSVSEKLGFSSNPHEVFTVTVSEVKREAKPKKVRKSPSHDHQLRRRPHNLISQDSNELDPTAFPDNLRGQHACQLVNELPKTYMPNKKCMLGFVVQATKVRLTCLIMSEEHRRLLELPEFEAIDSEHSATVYYTRSYDMLCKEERAHLMQIMVTLAKFTGDLGDI